ncbi:aminotransferase class I/II-fold pyridoxal phosphate-dependent enzyme [Eubacterium sp. OM08-24]|uniref:aminotransferase class I/II-fold pyridoxal phosphate-dependent enzyme n=1 Tax=Eubacterium sp. OM08-24 TaxID=2292352 RepID=UPI000E450FE5|nr:aminotransferase class I/II-fold pyridoxal phosphate-dependent enzyme [Eubacterium sp. OM08-24]RGM18070.1 aminotransferase class I/II-fold pyridoxal phosphate-dependent enzyme [Eubacterium sp. OM08-24]
MLYDKLKKYSKSGVYPFHMPGHKRNTALSDGTMPYEIDLTEIDGFDNLHNAEGCILEVQNLAERLYNVKKAFLLVNGATGGILSAVRAMTNRGDKVLVARNSHKSVYNALEICGLEPEYIVPAVDDEFGINCSITPLQVEKAIVKNPNTKLLIITSPTYEGVVSDIKEICRIAHLHNVMVLVDEAHGAHFPFSKSFPSEAVASGADAAVASLHKTLPSLTQTALLLTSNESLINSLAENLAIFETSSPSYIFMSAIEKCLEFCENASAFDEYIKRLNSFNEKCKSLKKIKVLCYGNDEVKNHRFFDFDISKITVSVRRLDINGTQLAEILRNDFKIEPEMVCSDYVLLISTVCDTDEGFARLINALQIIDSKCSVKELNAYRYSITIPKISVKPCECSGKDGEFCLLEHSIDKISLEYVWAYPPGIPIIAKGEIITQDIANIIIAQIASGINVCSTKGKIPKEIYCCI